MIRVHDAGKALPIMASALLGLLLAGCGLKGDLYLPEPEQPAPASAAGEPTSGLAAEPANDTGENPTRQPETAPGQP